MVPNLQVHVIGESGRRRRGLRERNLRSPLHVGKRQKVDDEEEGNIGHGAAASLIYSEVVGFVFFLLSFYFLLEITNPVVDLATIYSQQQHQQQKKTTPIAR